MRGEFKSVRWLLLIFILILLFFLDVGMGSVKISFSETFSHLIGSGEDEIIQAIIFKIRMPRALAAIIVGAALAVGGLLMQSLFGNPLAGPSVLGISSGASLGVAMVVLGIGGNVSASFLQTVDVGKSSLLVAAAFVGALMVFLLILVLASRLKDAVSLLIVGVMIGFLTNAIVAIGQYFSSPEMIQDFLLWSLGSLAGLNNSQLWVMGTLVGMSVLAAFFMAKPLNILLLGENYALSMGLSIKRIRIAIIGITSVLTAATVSFVGPIGFVGIAVPHLARRFFLTASHKTLIPASVLGGAILMLICDLISKLPYSQAVLPMNAVTGLVGAPIVIFVIIKRRS
ncbi:iron ABC transporter permease [Persicobacter diffluens]|uniref:Iron(III) ABC transporter permease n=1 Tax=Persicobacter diffluens TaxID=981 RepID=A0AAN4VXZ6_9BACT|nr:iron(III) ABC transporter permease [Persicobacter diffluens]